MADSSNLQSGNYEATYTSPSDDVITRAARDPNHMQRLLAEGNLATADAIFAAIRCDSIETLRLLLATGISPNSRPGITRDVSNEMDEAYATGREYRTVNFQDNTEWYPIQHAAYQQPRSRQEREQQVEMMRTLVNAGADIYATYNQQLTTRKFVTYPGQRDNILYPSSTEDSEPDPTYTARSIVHALLEDGACVSPIIQNPSIEIDFEQRDPNGRTLFLSACRSPIGIDAAIDSIVSDISEYKRLDSEVPDPFSTSSSRPSLFYYLCSKNADLIAVDKLGKNALHHLLESYDSVNYTFRPPRMRGALLHILSHHDHLVNKPDKQGNYPLHAALQRLLRYPFRWEWPSELEELDSVVPDLLSAGADPNVVDGKGNTALHYLAALGLMETLAGEQARSLLGLFLEKGVDINVRNDAGKSALHILLDDDGNRASSRTGQYAYVVNSKQMPVAKAEDVDAEVFEMFSKAKVNWGDVDSDGRTGLHIIASHIDNKRNVAWANMLVGKGVNRESRDLEGKTAIDIAREVHNLPVMEILKGDNPDIVSK
jgi:ankyrin repeat protein